MNTILTKQEVENLLPDYAFGKLAPDDLLLFEQSIKHYPDVQAELAEIQSSFVKVRELDFHSLAEQRTRNLSLRVNERLQAKSNRRLNINYSFFQRTILPVTGIALLAVLYFQLRPTSNESLEFSSKDQASQIEIIRPNDAQAIINDDISLSAVLEETSTLVTIPENIPDASSTIDELMAGAFQTWNSNIPSASVPNDELWLNFTDTELQDIMKDLSYENPSIL